MSTIQDLGLCTPVQPRGLSDSPQSTHSLWQREVKVDASRLRKVCFSPHTSHPKMYGQMQEALCDWLVKGSKEHSFKGEIQFTESMYSKNWIYIHLNNTNFLWRRNTLTNKGYIITEPENKITKTSSRNWLTTDICVFSFWP